MFRTYQKNDFAYFVSLIFLVFPVLGVFGGYFPVWTIVLTGLFTIAYLLMVYLKKAYSKWIPFLWFYTLAYIIFMTLTFQGGMMWFIFSTSIFSFGALRIAYHLIASYPF